jgi:cell division protein FtsI/penicillin-binding protein 2
MTNEAIANSTTATASEEEETQTVTEISTINVTDTTDTIEDETEESVSEDSDAEAFRGFILDAEMNIIVSSEGNRRKLREPYTVSLANVIDTYSAYFSVDRGLEDTLRKPNPTTIYSGDTPIGQSVKLTLDANLQTDIYAYMAANDLIGSVTILAADGSIKSLVSFPSYDANIEFDENREANATTNYSLKSDTPGSIIKILTSVIASKYNYDEYLDNGIIPFECDSDAVRNWNYDESPDSYPVLLTNRQALRVSSNCFYASFALSIGAEALISNLNSIFRYSDSFNCGFYHDISNGDIDKDTNTNPELARCGYGQRGKVSPLYMAMCSNAVITGEMNEPYILDSTIDTVTLETIENKAAKNTINTIEDELTENTCNGMLDVAGDLGFNINGYDSGNIYAKTGTAEIGTEANPLNDIHYIVVTTSNNTRDVSATQTVIFQYRNSPKRFASGDAPHMQNILNIIYKED